MKTTMRWHALGCAAAALLCGALCGGEMLVNENFDSMKLEELAPGWTKAEPASLSIVDENGRGKVLKISNKLDHYSAVTCNIDPTKAAGKIVRMTVWAKFPGAYTPIADKLWASPKLMVEFKDNSGVVIGQPVDLVPQAGKPEWQELKKDFTVPANTASLFAQVCVQWVEAEVFYDNLVLEVIGSAAPVAPPTPTPAGTTPTVAAGNAKVTGNAKVVPATVDPNSPAGIALRAPKKEMADDGMAFGPDHASKMLKVSEVKKATPNMLMLIGPGFNEKEALPKLPGAWKALPINPKLVGHGAPPRVLLGALPDVLVKEKPEVVLIAGDEAPGRKPTSTEAEDWEDVARLCMRMGAVPVLVMQPAAAGKNDGAPKGDGPGSKPDAATTRAEDFEAITGALRKTFDLGGMLALSAQPPDVYARRVQSLATLLDQFVFQRTKLEEKKTVGGKPVQDE